MDMMVGRALWVPGITRGIQRCLFPAHTISSYLFPITLPYSFLPLPRVVFPKIQAPESLPLILRSRHSSIPAPHCLPWHKLKRMQAKKKKKKKKVTIFNEIIWLRARETDGISDYNRLSQEKPRKRKFIWVEEKNSATEGTGPPSAFSLSHGNRRG